MTCFQIEIFFWFFLTDTQLGKDWPVCFVFGWERLKANLSTLKIFCNDLHSRPDSFSNLIGKSFQCFYQYTWEVDKPHLFGKDFRQIVKLKHLIGQFFGSLILGVRLVSLIAIFLKLTASISGKSAYHQFETIPFFIYKHNHALLFIWCMYPLDYSLVSCGCNNLVIFSQCMSQITLQNSNDYNNNK